MITRCPACATLFRVVPEQLQAHQGQVRCGRCMTVFDGLQALVPLPEPPPPPDTTAGGTGDLPRFELEAATPAAASAAPQAPAARVPDVAEAGQDYGSAPHQLSLGDDLFKDPSPAPRGAKRWWAMGVVLLVFVLAGQATYSYRGDLAARYPVLKPYLVQLCGVMKCKISPPQRPRQIAIEASDLQAMDPARPGLIQLTATLRNYAGHDLAYPALDLVLTNTKEHALARRIFLPADYLERGKDITAGIPANAEITVRLDLDTGELNPAGFRLDLLPAPPP